MHLQVVEKFGRCIGCVKGYGRKTVTVRERQTCTFLRGMILHNDHSPHIGTRPANTRKHVFKISRARQVPLLANLWPSLRTCARCCFDPSLASRKSYDSREIPSKFELHRANYQASKNVESTAIPRSYRVPTFRNACINFDLLAATLYSIRRDALSRW